MIKFTKTKNPNNEFDRADISIEIDNDDMTHMELAEYFDNFLKACGYKFDGEYELVGPDEEVVTKTTTAEKVLYAPVTKKKRAKKK